jgi:gliding motility-associated-like protein
LTATTSQVNVVCFGGSTGSASVVASGAVAPYTYSWSPTGGSNATASNLAAGTYICTITDANGATITKSVTVLQASVLSASTSQTNVSCNAGVNGAASVTVSGGTAPYTYSWSPSGGLTSSVSNLAAGSYTCTITDSNGCTLTKSFTITQPTAITATTSFTSISCNGGSNGVASVTAAGGTSGYTYSWSPSGGTNATASGLTAGTYTCTITDANGCFSTKSFTLTQPTLLTASTSQVNVSCNGGSTGSASVSVSGGTSGYTYAWSPSGGTSATASNLSAGSYSCLITDANGCAITKTFTITQPSQLTASTSQTNVAINGTSTGVASVVVSGGTSGYTYSWSPSGGTGATASNLAAGTYDCTVTDSKGCTVIKSFTITQPSAMIASTSQTNVSCNGASTGSASVSISGGAGGYTYLWAPLGGTSATATNLVAGDYTCSITDANGALLIKTFTITQPTLLTASTTQTNVLINGNSTGSSTITVSGGVTPYSYSWSPSGGTSATANGLAAGTYTVTATDANSCTISKTITITQPAFALTATTSQTNVLCNAGMTGAASVVVSGGVGPYNYSWSPSVGTGSALTGLSAGTYICTITDANGASIEKTIVITQPSALVSSTSQTNVGCNGATTGSASVTVTGGASGYTYLWSPSGGTSATASNLSAGTYSCLITDANGCTLTKTVTITQPTALSSSTSQTNVAINGATTGVASVSISGGTTPYSYVWSPSGGTGATASNLSAGSYSVVVTDANGCTSTQNFTLTQPTALTATTSQVNVVCFGGSTGSASVVASGAVAPYTYSWSPTGGTAATASNLAAGTYICTITDANGAINTKTVVITQNAIIPTPTADAGPSSDAVCANGSFTTAGVATNGTITWTTTGTGTFLNASNAVTVYTPSASDSASGSVVLKMTVTAPGTCNTPIATDTLNLTIYPVSNAGIIAGASTVCYGTNTTTLTLSENVGTVQWQSSTDNVNFTTLTGETSQIYIANNLTQTTYYRTLVTSGVCSVATSSVATIAVSPSSVPGTISGATEVCYGSNSTQLTLSGNVGNVVWQSSTDNSVFTTIPNATALTYTATNLTTTTYFRVAVSSGVCSAANSAAASIIVNPLPVSNAGPATASICASTNYTTQGVAQNGAVTWTSTGTGTFASNTSAVTVYTPSSADITAGSVILTMTVTGTAIGCTSNTSADTVNLTITAPTAPNATTAQTLCILNNPTVANLLSPGTNVQWYAAANGGIALAPSTALVNGSSYFATQTVGGCESITRTQVNVTLLCVINAIADTFNLTNGYTGGTTPSVLSNDTLNSALLAPANVQLAPITVPTGFTLNANGTITVQSGTPAGTYQVVYKICETANTTNCSQAIATVVVLPPVILAVADNYGPINGFQGETTATVLANDILNLALVNPTEITLTAVSLPTPLVLNADGTITIPAGTAAGIYEVVYRITENLNPTNFSQKTAVVTVNPCLFFANNDCDGDGVTNGQEILDGTNPSDLCSMNYVSQTVPTTAAWNQLDCDGDGVINGQEITDGTDPTGLCSFVLANQTVATNANWNNTDCDGDGVKNAIEILDGTNPSDSCSFDYIHITNTPTVQWTAADCDGDGVTNGQEILDGTNPSDVCSFDSGNLTVATSTAWKNADCDGDGVTNGQEVTDGTDPQDLCSLVVANQTATTSAAWKNADCDGDGVRNQQELTDNTDLLNVCSFNYLNQTVIPSNTWKNSDCDGDGVTNEQEIQDNTNPQDACSLVTASQTLQPTNAFLGSDCDGDGVINGQEITDGTDINNPCDSVWENITAPLSAAFLAGDCDEDGLTNGEEMGPNPSNPFDADNNGTPDYLQFNASDPTSEDEVQIYNAVTPNGNGENDVFVIRNIELYPDNTLTVFNRWGTIVYEVDRYGLDGQVFKGTKAVGGSSGEDLPIGTYFYTLRYVNAQGITKYRSGYLYLNK